MPNSDFVIFVVGSAVFALISLLVTDKSDE